MSAGSQFDEAAAAVAPNYPDTYYCVINGQISEADNMVPVFTKEYEEAAIDVAESRGISGASAKRAFINSWTDVSLTKSTTDQMIDNGADVAFCYSNE